MELGTLVAQRRAEMKLSQEKLAEMVGVTQGAISLIERDIKTPSLDLLVRLQNALGVALILPPMAPEDRQPAAQP